MREARDGEGAGRKRRRSKVQKKLRKREIKGYESYFKIQIWLLEGA